MKTLRKHLDVKLQNKDFKEAFEEEKKLLELSLELHEQRLKMGLNQAEAAKRARISQQQLSKIENGENCNMLTFIKVCKALNLNMEFRI
jgi:HTH-type transcriptional regulator / antitoxin HipB